MHPARAPFLGGASLPLSLDDGDVPESPPQQPLTGRGRPFTSAVRMQGPRETVHQPPGPMQQASSAATPTLSAMFRGLGFETSPRPLLGRGICSLLGRGMGDPSVKPKVDLPAQPKVAHSGPGGDGEVERALLGRGRTPDHKGSEMPFVPLRRAAVRLGRACADPSALGAGVFHSALLEQPRPTVSDEQRTVDDAGPRRHASPLGTEPDKNTLSKNEAVYQYRMTFSPNVECKSMRFGMMKEHKSVTGDVTAFVGSILYLPIKLPQVAKGYKVMHHFSGDAMGQFQNKVTMAAGHNFEWCCQSSVLLKCQRRTDGVEITKDSTDPNPRTQLRPVHTILQCFQEIWPGYAASIQRTDGGLFLLADVVHKVIQDDSVMDAIKTYGITLGDLGQPLLIHRPKERESSREGWIFTCLLTHCARQGCGIPTRYVCVANTANLSPDHMQRLTFKLCHMYWNWSGTVRVPAPCSYGHKLAFLSGQVLHHEPAMELCEKLFFL